MGCRSISWQVMHEILQHLYIFKKKKYALMVLKGHWDKILQAMADDVDDDGMRVNSLIKKMRIHVFHMFSLALVGRDT